MLFPRQQNLPGNTMTSRVGKRAHRRPPQGIPQTPPEAPGNPHKAPQMSGKPLLQLHPPQRAKVGPGTLVDRAVTLSMHSSISQALS